MSLFDLNNTKNYSDKEALLKFVCAWSWSLKDGIANVLNRNAVNYYLVTVSTLQILAKVVRIVSNVVVANGNIVGITRIFLTNSLEMLVSIREKGMVG